MDAIAAFVENLLNLPHYSYGWLVVAVLAILPAIISANLVQHELSKLMKGQNDRYRTLKSLLFNIVLLLICISVIAYAFYLYVWIQ
jgi:uncharacterized membrane protein